MLFYTSCLTKNGNVYIKYSKDGESKVKIKKYEPYLFIEGAGGYQTLDGKTLQKKQFSSSEEIEKFVSSTNKKFFGLGLSHRGITERDFAYAFLSDMFPGQVEYDLNQVTILNIDIETSSDEGFPDVDNPVETILSITCSLTKGSERSYKTFGIQRSNAEGYVFCGNEKALLSTFFAFVKNTAPDILTGWNVEIFDLSYICARTETQYSKEWLKSLSPFQLQPRKSTIEKYNKKVTIYKIDGMAVLDYLDLYKTFTYTDQESYKLDHIAHVELGERKLDYSEYNSLNELWKLDWEKFIQYNIKDVVLVDKLVDKLKLIELVISIAYYTKVNFNDALEKIRPIETLMYNYLIQKNIVLPLREAKEKLEQNAGGRVKSPKLGFSEWAVTLDATSLYPSIMMSLNLSPDTFVRKYDVNLQDILDNTFDNKILLQNNCAMSVNGCAFRKDKKGFTTELVEQLFDLRDEYKSKMKQLKKDNGDPNLIVKYDVFQQALKILANSIYGAFAAPYFLFFSMDWAEAITLTGQVVATVADESANKYLNTILKSDKDRVIFSDTDSIGVELKDLVDKMPSLISKQQKVEFINQFVNKKLSPVLETSFNELSTYLNLYQNRLSFKREKIIEKIVITSKKRYGMLVWDDEGYRYEEPKIVIKGLEIIKSSTPEFIKKELKESLNIILKGTEEQLQSKIQESKSLFFKSAPEDIAFPRGITKVTPNEKSIPIHVRAAMVYNNKIMQSSDLRKKFELIKDGDKLKFIYLKLPNPLRENVVGWKDFLPEEFGINKYIDYDTQFEKTFMSPLNGILTKIGWFPERIQSLSEFF